MADQLLTRRDVEKRLRLSRSAIYRHLRAGSLPLPLRISGRAVRWRSSEIEAYIDALPRAEGDLAEAEADASQA